MSSIAPEHDNGLQKGEVRVPSFAGYAGETAGNAPEGDELDIPAFLRRSH
jgi:hypothetical protein